MNRDNNVHYRRYAPRVRSCLITAFMAAFTLHATTARANDIPIADAPLFLGGGIGPNVFFELDDSGSMDWSVLTDDHWHFCNYDTNAPGLEGSNDCTSSQTTGGLYAGYTGSSYTTFAYMFDNDDDLYGYAEAFGTGPDTADPTPATVDYDWRVMNSSFNVQYFDPAVDYQPWWNGSDASFSSARSYPESNGDNDTVDDGYGDVRDLEGFTFTVWEDDRGFDGSRPHRGAGGFNAYTEVTDAIAQSGTESMSLEGGLGEATTLAIDTSGADTLTFWVAEGSDSYTGSEFPETGDELAVEYFSSGGTWIEIDRFSSGGDDNNETWNASHTLPAGAKHTNFALRFRSDGGSGSNFDYWHVDDVRIETGGGAIVFEDDFESGGFASSKWAVSGGVNANTTPNNVVDLWDKHTIYTVLDGQVEKQVVTYAPDTSGLNPTVVTSTLTTDAQIATDPNLAADSLAALHTDVANWYQYHRRRRQSAIAATGDSIESNSSFRYGISMINADWELFEEVPEIGDDLATHNADLFDALKAYDWSAYGTPLRTGLEDIGEYYSGNRSGTTDPIKYECQQNFTILMSDGFYNGADPNVGDVDGDGTGDTLADVARKYYETDLSGLANEVPTTPQDPADHQHMVTFTVPFGVEGDLLDTDSDGWPNPELGVSDAWTPTLNPSGGGDNPEKIDDMWHAAYNSAGEFLSAQNPEELSAGLSAALGEIEDRQGSAASVALNSQSYNDGSQIYQARFDSENWSGQVLAFELEQVFSADGQRFRLVPKDTPEWDAGALLDGDSPMNTRKVIAGRIPASNGSPDGVPFRWPADPANPANGELSAAQIAALNRDPDDTVDDGEGEDRLEYLRGVRDNEGPSGYRERSSVLGDIVNSSPVVVGAPQFLYRDNWDDEFLNEQSLPEDNHAYSDFFDANDQRDETVYVGSNDGMLHAFDAETGDEKLAFVPSSVFDNLNELTSQNYDHLYYVDGPPTYVDAYFDDDPSPGWRSVLVGGLNKGGQGVYALDVTDPSMFAESTANDIVLWEFTDDSSRDIDGDGKPEGDDDLGYTFSRPNVVRMHNGEWAAVFGNGYNSTTNDGTVGDGSAVLYVVDLETGELIRKIDIYDETGDSTAGTPGDPNGLSTVAPVDLDGDFIIDRAYAGDLHGNLWRFDFTSDDPVNWGVTKMFVTETEDPNDPSQTVAQPIFSRPAVGPHPLRLGQRSDDLENTSAMIYFGTGKYLGTSDADPNGQATQSFYAIWDVRRESNDSQIVYEKDDLLEQVVEYETAIGSSEVRITSDNDVGGWDSPSSPSIDGTGGWYMDLVNTDTGDNLGEKAITDPILLGDRIIFTTLVPSNSPCDFGGTGWLMELASKDGGRLENPPFDLDDDLAFDDSDTDSGKVPGGKKSNVGIVPTPAIMLTDGNVESKFMSGSSGSIESITESSGNSRGRQAWEELK